MNDSRSRKAALNDSSPEGHGSPASAGRLRDEILVLEKRLAQIGPDGDCGYENAMIRFFEQQLSERRARLRAAERSSVGIGVMLNRV